MAGPSDDRVAAASESIQATAKWIIAAFAGVGAALIAGLQLTGLGKLDLVEFLIAGAGLTLAIAAVLVAIWVVAKVLIPPEILLSELPEFVGELTTKDDTLLKGQAADLDTLMARFKAMEEASRLRWEAVEEMRNERRTADADAAEKQAEEKDKQGAALEDAIRFLRRLALNQKVRKAFKDMWWPWLIGAVIAVTIGVVDIAYMTNQPEEDPKPPPHTTKAVGQTPVGVRLVLTPDERKLLAPQLGKKCPTGPLWGMAIGGRPVALDIVTLPTPRCRSVRVIVTPEMGIVIHRSPLRRVVHAEQLAREST